MWPLFVLGAVAIGVIVLAIEEIGPPSSSARTSTQIVTAQKGVVQSTVSGTGNVEAGADLDVNFQASGTLSRVYVKVGQYVSKGQLLATLDQTSALLTLDQAENNLTAAQDQLTAAEDASSSSSTTTSTSLTGSSPATEFVTYETKRTKTTPASTTTTTPASTTPTLTTPTSTTTTPHTTTTAPKTRGSGSGGSRSSSSGSSGSGSGSSGSGSSGSTGTTSSAGSIPAAQASVDSAQASVHSAEQGLANTKLYAPISGTIVSLAGLQPGDSVTGGSTSSSSASSGSSSSSSASDATGTTAGSLGGSGSTGSTGSSSSSGSSSFAEIVNTSRMTMTVAFSESDVSKLKVGQSATVTLDALTGVELGAHVTAISTVGTTSSSVVSYDATLTLDQRDSRVKPGMSASASVIVKQAQGVTVPNAAITGSGSLATLNVVKDRKKVSQQVVVGLKGDSRTVIISGLKAGDRVALTTTLPSLGSSSTSSGSSGSTGTLGGGITRRFGGAGGLAGGAGFPAGGGFAGGG
jgi:multidrug efflux pump subunit AcrA (membrane-fusion protein)